MNGVIAVVLTYHPDGSVLKNIATTLKQVDSVVVVDNQSSVGSQNLLRGLSAEELSRVEYIWNKDNEGVAKGFNQGIQKALEFGASWILLLDQDSEITAGMVDVLLNAHAKNSSENDLVLVGPRYGVRPQDKHLELREVPFLITSGTLVSKGVVEKVGLYREDFFIDHVDHEYCLRMKRLGGRCFQIESAFLNHHFGASRKVSFLGFEFWVQDYSPTRRYYMMRNRVLLYRMYGGVIQRWCWVDGFAAFKDLVKMLIWEKCKFRKVCAIIEGIRDGARACL